MGLQPFADTLGIGGIMRGCALCRSCGVSLKDMTELCPDAVMLQYGSYGDQLLGGEGLPDIQTVGLCHSVPNTVLN